MKNVFDFFNESSISAFGWTLIHSVWQGTVLMILAVGVFYFLKKRSASMRYLAGVLLLTGQVVASAVTFFYYFSKPVTKVVSGNSFTNSFSPAQITAENVRVSELPLTFKIQSWITLHLYELVICWLIGAAILMLRFAAGWIFTERLRYNARIVMDREWRARFGVITARMNISQSIEFKESARISSPMVIGAFSPVILIPIGLLSGFSTSQVEAILAHELAHIRRNDYLINMLQSLVEVIFFFHPAIWWLSDRIRAEREHCCDDIALTVCGDKLSLAHALVKVAEWQTTPRMAMAFASKKPLLLQRVQRVLGLSPKPGRTLGKLPLMLLAFCLAAGLSLYAVAQKTDKKKEKKAAHATAKKNQKLSSIQREESEIAEVLEPVEVEEFVEIPDIEFNEIPDFTEFVDNNDSLSKKRNEIQKRMQALQTEMEPLNRRIEEINLEMEKQRFEVERHQRELEKIEWKKEGAAEIRQDLMEKRATLLEQSRSGESKTNESDLDKQLADFEQQIKVQEETISQLNSQIAATRKEVFKSEEPIRKYDTEIQGIIENIEEINGKIGLESLSFDRLENLPRMRTSKPARVAKTGRRTPPPPPPAVSPARPAKVPAAAKPTPPPAPPLPPAKK